jgi:hypothetical protein
MPDDARSSGATADSEAVTTWDAYRGVARTQRWSRRSGTAQQNERRSLSAAASLDRARLRGLLQRTPRLSWRGAILRYSSRQTSLEASSVAMTLAHMNLAIGFPKSIQYQTILNRVLRNYHTSPFNHSDCTSYFYGLRSPPKRWTWMVRLSIFVSSSATLISTSRSTRFRTTAGRRRWKRSGKEYPTPQSSSHG